MFRQAVLRLTLLYLALLMSLSISFSLVLYRISGAQLDEVRYRQEENLRRAGQLFFAPPDLVELEQERLQAVEEGKRELLLNIIYFNLAILLAGGLAAYLLARRTLLPIEKSLEAQARFTADASHELRTPLTAIRTELEVALRDKSLTLAESRTLHASTLEEVGRLERLSTGLLRLAQQDARSKDQSWEECTMAQIVEEAVARVAVIAKSRKTKIIQQVSEGSIGGDRWGLAEALSILLDNALKYSSEGSTVKLAAGIHGHAAVFSVTDEGVGISPEQLPHIFDRFYRADASRTQGEMAGYGLGLSIAQKIIQGQGGKIEVESQLGKGSTFTIRVPRQRSSSHPSK